MKTLFKIIMLMLITSLTIHAQKHTIIDKNFKADKNTTAIFNIDQAHITIEESTDGKVHFLYTVEFEGFSKKKIKNEISKIQVEANSLDNQITLNANSKSQFSDVVYTYSGEEGIVFTQGFSKKKKDTVVRKTKDSLIKELYSNDESSRFKNPFEYFNNKFKTRDKNGKLVNVRPSGVSMMRGLFKIKIPPYLKVVINGKQSEIKMNGNFRNDLNIDLKGGFLRLQQILNTHNKLKIDDANFEAEALFGGDYQFKNIRKGKIGSIQNVNITSEFSEIEIGEIDKETTITDFNSEYYFYNWASDFKRFDLYSEYSKIYFFYPKDNFNLEIIGNNTKNFLKDDFVIRMQPNKNGEKYTMMTTTADPDKSISGSIFFDIVHGIIYSKDFILTKIEGGEKALLESVYKN